jgi:hypothetical protein
MKNILTAITGIVLVAGTPAETNVVGGVTNVVPAVEAQMHIVADYQLRANVPVVNVTQLGVTTTIIPKSNPTFVLDIKLPLSAFEAFYGGDASGLVQAIVMAGAIKPNAQLTGLIRQVAVQVITADDEE